MADTPVEREVEGVWDRLRRRKVVQWGLGYAAVAWAALQGVEYLSGTFDWPREIQRWATVALILALPIIVTLAWYHGDKGEQRVSRAEFAVLAVLLLLGGGVLWWFAQREAPANVAETETAGAPPAMASGAGVSAGDVAGPSIAVLPFENRSRLEDDAFFVDGIHDDILTQLSKVSALKVISRTSVERFRDTELSGKEIARQLGVTSLLEGGVQRAGDRVRINVQLIDATNDAHLWAESYDRELTGANIFAIQSEVATAIAGALKTTLTPAEKARVAAIPTRNLEAWENYQLGQQRLARRTAKSIAEAAQFYRKAIELDPGFALAYAGLSFALAIGADYTDVRFATALDEARSAADLALQLDPGLADAWASAAFIAAQRNNYELADELYRRAIELDPNHAMALKFYANLLSDHGRTDEAIRYLERAASLDPLSAIIQENLGATLEDQGKFDEAAARYRRVIEIDPEMPAGYLSLAGVARGNLDFAIALRLEEKAAALDPDNPDLAIGVALAYWQLGDEATFDELMRKAQKRWPDNAAVHAWLTGRDLQRGDTKGAERHARRALELDPDSLPAVYVVAIIDYREGRYAESVAHWRKWSPEFFAPGRRLDASNYDMVFSIVPALRKLGKDAEAIALLDAAEKVIVTASVPRRAAAEARLLALRGRKQEALAALRAAERAGFRGAWQWIRDFDMSFDSIRDDPEFKAIFAEVERDMARQRAELARLPKDAPLDLAAIAPGPSGI